MSVAISMVLAALFIQQGWMVWAHRTPWAKVTALTLTDSELHARIDYSITDPQWALDLRERFDRDIDRTLSIEEQARLKEYLVQQALRPLRVALNGAALSFTPESVTASGLEERLPSSYPITVAIVLQASKLKILSQSNTIGVSDCDVRVQRESLCRVMFPKAFRFQVPTQPEVIVSGNTIWRVFTGKGQELQITFRPQ